MVAEFEQSINRSVPVRRMSPTFIRNLAQIVDSAVILVVGMVAYFVYVLTIVGSDWESPYFVSITIGTVISCIVLHNFGAYSKEHLFSKWHATQRIIAAWAVSCAILLFIAFALKITDYYSRVWAVTWFCAAGGLLLVARISLCEWMQRRAKEGALAERSVILGAGDLGQRFAAQVQEFKDPYTMLLGFIDDRTTRVPKHSNGLEVLGDSDTLLRLIRANLVDQVFVALPWSARQRLAEVIKQLALTPVRITLVPDSLGFDFTVRAIKYMNKVPTLVVLERPLTGWSHLVKWIEDRLVSAIILVFIAPLFVLIALAIKLGSKGPVFFKQRRYGFNNNQIEVWKFRTMYTDDGESDGPMRQATQDDPRITPLGRLLRKSSLDELPQFINVLLGDMSIVGPRPHAVAHTYEGQQFEDIIDTYVARHRVKPGITGWAQINGWRGETDTIDKIKKRVEFDLYYIENWSIWFDIYIIFKTVLLIFRDGKAY